MEYIILAAGVGTRLYPYTKHMPKCLVKSSKNECIIERAVRLIKKYDTDANITVVLGFQANTVKKLLGDKCEYIINPFYKVTNSIASLWFAKDILLKKHNTVILNADIVFSEDFAVEICTPPAESIIYYDSSIKTNGDYNVQVYNGVMTVMGKELVDYEGEYVGITKISTDVIPILLQEIDYMINDNLYDQWYENALVQLSLNKNIQFNVYDTRDFQWSEIDAIGNLLKIRQIINSEDK